jgi:hypothetical protein
MRNFQLLASARIEGKYLYVTDEANVALQPMLVMLREGDYVSLSVSIGALELALRLQHEDLKRQMEALKPVPGLTTTRQVGGGQSLMSIGINADRRLILRPTLITDAGGHLTINLVTAPEVYDMLIDWLNS